jgi:predicted type IV restriction endonuclease
VSEIPKKVRERLVDGIKQYQPIVQGRKQADICEADTVLLVTDLLAELFGYDRHTEITSEVAIKNTFCDLATKVDGKLQTLIEVKSIGHPLKDSHVTQAANYAANQPIGWVLLTNGQWWNAYCVTCKGQVNHELVVSIDLLAVDHKSEDDLDTLYVLCKEGWAKSAIDDYKTHRDALDRYLIGATILSDRILQKIRTELHKVSPGVRIDADDVKQVIESEVIKRELLEGDKAAEAKRTIAKAAKVALKAAQGDNGQ